MHWSTSTSSLIYVWLLKSLFKFQSSFRDDYFRSLFFEISKMKDLIISVVSPLPNASPRTTRATAQLLNSFLCFDFDSSQWQIARSVTWPTQLSNHSKVSADQICSWSKLKLRISISLCELSWKWKGEKWEAIFEVQRKRKERL